MLPSGHRFKLRQEKTFFTTASRVHRTKASYYVQKSAVGESKIQVTVIVPKTTAPLAVQRHYIKRKLYQAWLDVMPTLPEMTLKLVMVVKKKGTQETVSDWKKELVTFFKYHGTTHKFN